ncbi:MAG: hypothetical protein FWC15_06830 [Fibromonadales bacterium]|nr:hypothetical protein [Fibromonadales bacterium]
MTLLENETKLDLFTESVFLTNYRIMQENGDSHKIFIFLEKISSIEMRRKSKLFFLLLGIFFMVLGLVLSVALMIEPAWRDDEELAVLGITVFLGIIFFIIFFLTKGSLITISPDGGKNLNIKVSRKITGERIEEFLTKIQNAKLARTMS